VTDSFCKAQAALKSSLDIVIPKLDDQLITHDDAKVGIGSVLFVKRDGNLRLGVFFSSKLKAHHAQWLSCEVEALSIATSIDHFAPHIRESKHPTQILTDSKPCVQAWGKMTRVKFSTSARIATFLLNLLRYSVKLHVISGEINLPSDFHSRNPQPCDSPVRAKFANLLTTMITLEVPYADAADRTGFPEDAMRPIHPPMSEDTAEQSHVHAPDPVAAEATSNSVHQESESPPDVERPTKLRPPSKRRQPKRLGDYELY
jgi:hypothetical protein